MIEIFFNRKFVGFRQAKEHRVVVLTVVGKFVDCKVVFDEGRVFLAIDNGCLAICLAGHRGERYVRIGGGIFQNGIFGSACVGGSKHVVGGLVFRTVQTEIVDGNVFVGNIVHEQSAACCFCGVDVTQRNGKVHILRSGVAIKDVERKRLPTFAGDVVLVCVKLVVLVAVAFNVQAGGAVGVDCDVCRTFGQAGSVNPHGNFCCLAACDCKGLGQNTDVGVVCGQKVNFFVQRFGFFVVRQRVGCVNAVGGNFVPLARIDDTADNVFFFVQFKRNLAGILVFAGIRIQSPVLSFVGVFACFKSVLGNVCKVTVGNRQRGRTRICVGRGSVVFFEYGAKRNAQNDDGGNDNRNDCNNQFALFGKRLFYVCFFVTHCSIPFFVLLNTQNCIYECIIIQTKIDCNQIEDNRCDYGEIIMNFSAKNKTVAVLCGVLAGFVNGFLGGGGGVVVVSALLTVFSLNQKCAQATALLVILPLTAISAAVYVLGGFHDWADALWTTVGVIVGGIVGALILGGIKSNAAKIAFAVLLIFGGVKMFF